MKNIRFRLPARLWCRLLAAVGLANSLLLPAGMADTPAPTERVRLERRVEAVRASLAAQAERNATAEEPQRLAQWVNWPNWGNWSKWPNWNNWANWPNWANWFNQ